MDAFQDSESVFNSTSLDHTFPRKNTDKDVAEIKENVSRTLKDAKRKLIDLRNEVERKDNIIRQANLVNSNNSHVMDLEYSTEYSSSKRFPLYNNNYENPIDSEKLLHDEIKVLDSLNDSLMEKLARTESKLEATRMHNDEISLEAEAKIAAKGAALVEKIYKAQKERDAAVLSRLRLANEERDEVLARMKRLEQEQQGFDSGVDSIFDDDEDDLTMKDLFKKLVDSESGASISKHGDLILAKYKKHGKGRQIMAAEEIQALIDERDDALYKVRALEKEVKSKQEEMEMMKQQFQFAEKTRIKSGQAQLMAAQQEKDATQLRIKELEEEVQNYRQFQDKEHLEKNSASLNSLHRSLSQEQTLRDQFNATMNSFETKLNEREKDLVVAQNNTKELVARLQAISKERDELSLQLSQALSNHKKEKERTEKLERLVSVLRKE